MCGILVPQPELELTSTALEGSSSFTFFFLIFTLINLFGCVGSQLWHARSSSLTRDQTQTPLHWEHKVLATGTPGKSIHLLFKIIFGGLSRSVAK